MSDIHEGSSPATPEQKRALLEHLLKKKQASKGKTFPLSFAQQRLWFLERLHPNSAVYNIAVALRIFGPLQLAALEQSIQAIVQRHETLRTTFTLTRGQSFQMIAPRIALQPCLVSLELLAEEEREQQALSIAEEEQQQPFDLEKGPLLRVLLIRLGQQDHIFCLTIHHIVSDGWSMNILYHELSLLYNALMKGIQLHLPELPIQYVDYTVWQREQLQGEAYNAQLTYWRKQLEDVPVTQLPLDFPRPTVQTFHGMHLRVRMPSTLTYQLKRFSQQEGVTLFMTLLGGLSVLLSRYTGQEDIVIGTLIANRTRREIEGLIGFFANTLALRINLSAHPDFRQLLSRVKKTCIDAYTHQIVPFEKLVEELNPERNLSYSPLFQVLLQLQNTPGEPLDLQGLMIEPVEVAADLTKFDLTLHLEESAEGLGGYIEYNTALFHLDSIRRLWSHFQTLLEGIVTEPERAIATLPLLTTPEHEQFVLQPQYTKTRYSQHGCLHTLFEEQVQQGPDRIAISYEEQFLTYQELNRRANQLAHYLQQMDVSSEDRIGLYLDRSPMVIIGILGVLKAGGNYVPLDLTYPRERLAFLLSDAHVSILLTEERLREQISGSLPQAQIIALDADQSLIRHYSSTSPAQEAVVDQAAYTIYTSGSSGKPKGVIVSHSNAVRLFQATHDLFHFDAHDTWTLFHSPAFDFSVWEIWGALLFGGRLIIVPYLVSRSPEAFYNLLYREQVTMLNQTPSAFYQLQHYEEITSKRYDLSLRYIIFGGEALNLQYLKPWFTRHRDNSPQLVNMYGITETTVHVTYRLLSLADIEQRSGSMIGWSISDEEVYVLDRYFQPMPIGVPGELFIGGAGLTRGYLGHPDLTAERFIPHPWSTTPGARLYRTGDVACYRSNRDLEYLGRLDQQVKLRGFRIEPGEIESIISAFPAVRECVVLLGEDEPTEKRLVAYIVLHAAADIGQLKLMPYLQERLPEYMIPGAFMLLETLPLTVNGKVDTQALLLSNAQRLELLEREFVVPRTAIEKVLAEIWAEVLDLEQVSIHDNFFQLGGDSIRSLGILALASEHHLNLSLEQLFHYQTIHALAQELAIEEIPNVIVREQQPFSCVALKDRSRLPHDLEDAYPLTMMQQGMLFLSSYNPELPLYHNITSYHIQAPFNPEALYTAIHHIAAHYPVLRTSFDLAAYSQPLQLVHQTVSIALPIEDISSCSSEEQEQVVTLYIETEKQRKFVWQQAPLFRLQVHYRSQYAFQLTITEHHAILDGWSVALLLTDLFQEYMGLLHGEDSTHKPLPPTAVFRDYVELEQEALRSEEAQKYWLHTMADATVTLLPRWPGTHKTGVVHQGKMVQVPLSPTIVDELERLALVVSVPLRTVLLAAHVRVLSMLQGVQDIITGLVSNGRPETTAGERSLGLFLNTLPHRQKLRGGSWIDLIRETFEAEQASLPFRRYPYAQIQRECGGQALFETCFNFLHLHIYRELQTIKDFHLLDERGFSQTNFTLSVHCIQDPLTSKVEVRLEYDRAALSDEQIHMFCDYYARVLEAMVHEPFGRYERVNMLSEQERQQILLEWNRGKPGIAEEMCLHQFFEEQVELTPDAIAISFEDEYLTYGELNSRANQLARYLQKLDVGPEVCVGLYLERSPHLIIGLLGVLKAGGTYVPLELSYPQERIRFLITDARIHIILTQEVLPKIAAYNDHLVYLDTNWQQIAHECPDNVFSPVEPANLAYIIYTSGTSGHPKGVLIPHRALGNLAFAQADTFSIHTASRVLQFASIAFDASISEIAMTLLTGAILCLERQENLRPGPAFLHMLRERTITAVTLPPTVLAALSVTEFPALHSIIVAGEACSQPVVARWGEGRQLFNAYGPTETTVCATIAICSDQETPPIGYPIAGTQVYVLDAYLQPVPVGVSGELYIAGVGVARGYLHLPELTAEHFIPHPWSTLPGERLYKTGDKVRFLPEGALEYMGRLDRQIKLRGFRIEVDEVEAILLKHPTISEVAVILQDYGEGNRRLVAYLVTDASSPLSSSQLRHYMQERVPNYMIPSAFVILEKLPRTISGKLDRRALPATHWVHTSGEEYVAPRTVNEQIVANIWADIFKLPQVSIRDNFFSLGGDSIISMQIISRLQQAGLRLMPRQVFELQTIEKLCEVIGSVPLFTSAQHPATGICPLTPIQQWFFSQQHANPHNWNQAMLLEVSLDIRPQYIEQAIQAILLHHDALRLRFEPGDHGWQQRIDEFTGDIPFSVVDASDLSREEQEEMLQAVEAEAHGSLHLTNGPLLRVVLMLLDADQPARLLIVIHHLAVDGVSWRIVLEDIQTVLQQLMQREELQLPRKTTSFKHWAEQLAIYSSSDALQQELSYWLNNTRAATSLPVDFTSHSPGNTMTSTGQVNVSLTRQETRGLLEDAAPAYQVRISEVLIAALALVLRERIGEAAVLIDIEGHGREEIVSEIDLIRTIGWFTSLFPLQVQVPHDASAIDLLFMVKEHLRSIPHGGIGYGILRYLSQQDGIREQLNRQPQAEVLLNYLGQFDSLYASPTMLRPVHRSTEADVVSQDVRLYLIEINSWISGGQLHLIWTYSKQFYRQETMEHLAATLVRILRMFIAHSYLVGEKEHTSKDFS